MNPRTFSPWLLVAALACFFLPFFNVSCQNNMIIARLSGQQLVTGAKAESVMLLPDLNSPRPQGASRSTHSANADSSPQDNINPEIFAIIDAAGIVVALFIAFAAIRQTSLRGIAAIGVALVLHIALLIRMTNYWVASQVPNQPQSGDNPFAGADRALAQSISVTPSTGWYLVGVLLLLALVAQILPKFSVSAQRY